MLCADRASYTGAADADKENTGWSTDTLSPDLAAAGRMEQPHKAVKPSPVSLLPCKRSQEEGQHWDVPNLEGD